VGCALHPARPASPRASTNPTKSDRHSVHTGYYSSNSKCFAEPAFVYGTGADEKCLGSLEIRAHLERDWTQSLSASFTLIDPHITTSDSFAWVASDCRFEFRTTEGDGSISGRVSFFLKRTDGGWRICHAHFSAPTPTEVGQSF
jgi:ketosteroid isomerase-like protein